MSKVLWLTAKNFSGKQRSLLTLHLHKAKIDPAQIFYVCMHNKIASLWIRKPGTKQTWICNEEKSNEFDNVLAEYIEKIEPSIIVISDEASLGFITKRHTSLDLCNGSVYSFGNVPCLVIDRITKVKQVKWGSWIALRTLNKLRRWMDDTKQEEPKFVYSIARDRRGIDRAKEYLNNCFLIVSDNETFSSFITCVGFTGVNDAGDIKTFVVPFYNPLNPGNCHWEKEEDEIYAWQAVKEILSNDAFKGFQNGSYDTAWNMRYNLDTRKYLLDSMHLFHSIWTEAPKKLNQISALLIDHYRFWKDERKADEDERVPSTPDGYERYLRYNGLDCYYAALDIITLLPYYAQLEWVQTNYAIEFKGQIGPALMMSMTGALVDTERKREKNIEWLEEFIAALKDLRIMCDDDEFNPNSPQQVASLIYDVLGAKPIKMRGRRKDKSERSTGEDLLRLIKLQHPLYAIVIDKLWAAKKARNNAAKYGNMQLINNRFLYQYGAGQTETGRYNGKEHQFWVGTNPQNIPYKARDIIIADRGYIMWEADFSQSDMYFVAHESEDPDMLRNIMDARDTHCVHAEFFFNQPYEKVLAAHERGDPWADDPIEGIRQNTKRIGHGANYWMKGFTLYMKMGHEAVVATAKALGYKDAHLWERGKLVELCEVLIKKYTHKLYRKLPEWFEDSAKACKANKNLATCAFGRTRLFFGDIESDEGIKRELAAYYGQGGTAGNINRTLHELYYRSEYFEKGGLLIFQTHDSIAGQVPEDKIELIDIVLTIMEQPCTIKGRTFVVPAECKIGLTWGKGLMTKYQDFTSLEDLIAKDRAFQKKNYPNLVA